MALFFFVVGLEIKRELVVGELREPRRASLPVLAALGGVVVPAGIFLLLNAGGQGASGWGIPMATDIAFAVGVLAVLGSRVPAGAKVFLLTLAIVDDILAITVIAVFYTGQLAVAWVAVAAAGMVLVLLLRQLGVRAISAYVPLGVLVWLATLESGVHATIAGVALGLATPARPVGGRPVLEQLQHRLHPLSSYLVIPLFALANAGVPLGGDALGRAARSPVAWGWPWGCWPARSSGWLRPAWPRCGCGWAPCPTT
jgi:Na+:H+ antiporter, NhaA family